MVPLTASLIFGPLNAGIFDNIPLCVCVCVCVFSEIILESSSMVFFGCVLFKEYHGNTMELSLYISKSTLTMVNV